MAEISERRLSFGSVAEQYDAARPSYPQQLVDDVIAYAGVGAHDPVLEVGAGTGIATQLFAVRTDELAAVEPSGEMAAIAQAKLPQVSFVHAGFEDAKLPKHHFKLLYSAQAWHWVDPDRRYQLAHDVLVPAGALACFWNWPDWDRCTLREAFDEIYARAGLSDRVFGTQRLGDTTAWQQETAALFAHSELRSYQWTRTFTSSQYVELLGTHSDHLLLTEAERRQVYGAVSAVIDAHGGSFELPHLTRLALARK